MTGTNRIMKKLYIQPTTVSETAFSLSTIICGSPEQEGFDPNYPFPNPAPVRNTLIVK